MATFTQELRNLLDSLTVLEQRLSRTLCFTGQEMPSWEQLSEEEQQMALLLGQGISVTCHHLQTYSGQLPTPPGQGSSGGSTTGFSGSGRNTLH